MLYKFLYPIGWILMKAFFFLKIEGREKIKHSDRLIVYANHISYTDPISVCMAMGFKFNIHFMAKQELFDNHKLFGRFLRAMGSFPIRRGTGATEGVKTAMDVLNSGHTLGIFPEGTRSKDGKLGKAKSGISMLAAKSGADIQPIVIITKNQKVKPFRRIKVVICEQIPAEKIKPQTDNLREMRKITETIMRPIIETLEPETLTEQ